MTKTSKLKLEHFWLDELTTKEAKEAALKGTVIILPVGSVEEHGDHLPLGTDSIQPEYVAVEVAKKTGCLIAPPFRYGICNSARNFPGTLTIKFDTLYNFALDVLSELERNGFNKIIVLSGHAGSSHMVALRLAAQAIVDKNKATPEKKTRIMVLSDYDFADDIKDQFAPENDGHAGAIETSRVMAIEPKLVRTLHKPIPSKTPRFEVVADPERYFPNGVHGDPTLATVEKGNKINQYIIEQVEKLVKELQA